MGRAVSAMEFSANGRHLATELDGGGLLALDLTRLLLVAMPGAEWLGTSIGHDVALTRSADGLTIHAVDLDRGRLLTLPRGSARIHTADASRTDSSWSPVPQTERASVGFLGKTRSRDQRGGASLASLRFAQRARRGSFWGPNRALDLVAGDGRTASIQYWSGGGRGHRVRPRWQPIPRLEPRCVIPCLRCPIPRPSCPQAQRRRAAAGTRATPARASAWR
jgi:hypothetical protein